MQFKRKQSIRDNIYPKRVLMLYGPRRVGKTTLLQSFLRERETIEKTPRILSLTGDDFNLRALFQSEKQGEILDFAQQHDFIAIDEAQSIPSIGLGVKMIIDAFPEKTIILTGSASK